MTKAQLIKYLEGVPDDAEIYLADWNEDYADPVKLTTVIKKRNQFGGVRVILDHQEPIKTFRPA